MESEGAVDTGSRAALTPLGGVRVLEVGRRLGVASAGLFLTALGADVVQPRLRGRSVPPSEAVYYDRGRRVVAPGEALGLLAAAADVIVTDLDDTDLRALGLPADPADLRAGIDGQVLVAVRSLGRHGPSAHFAMTDLTEWAASGLAQITRRPHDDPDRYVPCLPPGQQPQALAGLAAAIAALAGRRWVRATGQPVVADVSVQEVVNALLHGVFPNYVWNGIVTGHPDSRATSLGMMLPASDGDVYIRTLDPRQWDALMEWVDNDAVAALGAEPDSRLANTDAITLLLGEFTAGWSRLALLEEGQRRRIPIALPRSLHDVLAWQHLRARGAWRPVTVDRGRCRGRRWRAGGVGGTAPRAPARATGVDADPLGHRRRGPRRLGAPQWLTLRSPGCASSTSAGRGQGRTAA